MAQPGRGRDTSLTTYTMVVNGRRTSVRVEAAVWDALAEIAWREDVRVADICARVDAARSERTLAASLRVYALRYFRRAAAASGVPEGNGT